MQRKYNHTKLRFVPEISVTGKTAEEIRKSYGQTHAPPAVAAPVAPALSVL